MTKEDQLILTKVRNALIKKTNHEKAIFLNIYLRSEYYGLGDKFLGLTVPDIRIISKEADELPFSVLRLLIKSRTHEERFLSTINLVNQFRTSQKKHQSEKTKIIFEFYIKEMLDGIDNWDLVDVSADKIVGAYLIDKPELKEHYLYQFLSTSSNLWKRRIAIVSTFHFIKKSHFSDTIRLAKLFLNDREDLIHKSVGWMLREVGKKDERLLINFLEKHYLEMPRTMLRYSLEKLEPNIKSKYLKRF